MSSLGTILHLLASGSHASLALFRERRRSTNTFNNSLLNTAPRETRSSTTKSYNSLYFAKPVSDHPIPVCLAPVLCVTPQRFVFLENVYFGAFDKCKISCEWQV